MWGNQRQHGSRNYDEEVVHGKFGDFNVPPGYGGHAEQIQLLQYQNSGYPYPMAVHDGLLRDANHHLSEEDFAEQDEHEMRAGMSRHHCTDMMCLVIFSIALVFQGLLVIHGYANGDIKRLTHGYNFTGHLCGVGDNIGKPYLYWCQKNHLPGADAAFELDVRHPMCVESCPTSYTSTRVCYRKMEKVVGEKTTLPDGSGFYVEEKSKFIFSEVHDYVSEPFLDRYCLPKDLALSAQLQKALNSHPMTKHLMDYSQLGNVWVPMIFAVFISIGLGYVYILLLDKCATILVYTAIILTIVTGVLTGFYLIFSEFFGGIDGIPNTGDSKWNLLTGFGLLLISGVAACFAVLARSKIEVAIACVQVAADCMFDMPTMMFEPLISVALKIVTFLLLIGGFLQLASVGKVRTMTLEQFSHRYEQFSAAKVSGVFRTFQYHDSQYWFFAYYVIVGFWILCSLTALSQFVLAYSVQLWYFTPCIQEHKDAPACSLFRGYYIGATCHLGSLVFGSIIITVLQLVRLGLSTLAKAGEAEGNPVLAVLAKCCFCCVTCYERFIEFLNKNAYMDIAINSTSFCTAAKNALQVMASEIAAVSFLNGACWILTFSGYAMITSVGTFWVWLMIRSLWWFNNVDSSWYVADPLKVCFLAAIVCFAIAVGFMIVFDMVADTVLYCFATEERRKQRGLMRKDVQYAPKSLNRLIEKHAAGGSSYDDAYNAYEHDDYDSQVSSSQTLDGDIHAASYSHAQLQSSGHRSSDDSYHQRNDNAHRGSDAYEDYPYMG